MKIPAVDRLAHNGDEWTLEEPDSFLPVSEIHLSRPEVSFVLRIKLEGLRARRVEVDASLLLEHAGRRLRLVVDPQGATAKLHRGAVLTAYDVRWRLRGKR